MKRNFCFLAMMALFLFPIQGAFSSKPTEVQLNLIKNYIEEAAARERLEPRLISAIIQAESDFNFRARSPVGAQGLMQLMPDTADEIGFSQALHDSHPRANILAGTKYIRQLINRFRGDLVLAIAAYNAGPKAVEKYKAVPPYRETQNYVRKVMEFYRAGRK